MWCHLSDNSFSWDGIVHFHISVERATCLCLLGSGHSCCISGTLRPRDWCYDKFQQSNFFILRKKFSFALSPYAINLVSTTWQRSLREIMAFLFCLCLGSLLKSYLFLVLMHRGSRPRHTNIYHPRSISVYQKINIKSIQKLCKYCMSNT